MGAAEPASECLRAWEWYRRPFIIFIHDFHNVYLLSAHWVPDPALNIFQVFFYFTEFSQCLFNVDTVTFILQMRKQRPREAK